MLYKVYRELKKKDDEFSQKLIKMLGTKTIVIFKILDFAEGASSPFKRLHRIKWKIYD